MDTFFQILGYVAATLSTIAFVPQIINIFKTRDTRSISLGMYIIFVLGIICWLSYGIYKMDLPIIIANSVSLVFSSIILIAKIINVVKGERAVNKKEVIEKDE
jgi:MtN3 and saliva related transmembrane protein